MPLQNTKNISLLVDALADPSNKEVVPNTIVSQLYEKLSGNTLFRDTDPVNGEDYEYKHGFGVEMTSVALHPEVSEFFGFKCNYLRVNQSPLFFMKLTNAEIAAVFNNNTYSLLH